MTIKYSQPVSTKEQYLQRKRALEAQGLWNAECPYCASDMVSYDEAFIVGDVEWWSCSACKRGFFVDIEIRRLSARKSDD
jgi:transposase-like protein